MVRLTNIAAGTSVPDPRSAPAPLAGDDLTTIAHALIVRAAPGFDLDAAGPGPLRGKRVRWAAILLAGLAAAVLLAWLVPLLVAAFDHAVTLPLYRRLLRETAKLAAICAALCLLAGYPLAWLLRLGADRVRHTLLLGVIAPSAIGAVTRALGWVVVVGEFGLINLMLRALRLEAELPRQYLAHELTVLASMAQVFLPFTILALFRGFQAVPTDMMRAARSLGAPPGRVFREVVLPQTATSALTSVAVVFGLAAGAYVTVVLMGGSRVRVLAGLAFQESTSLLDWQIGAVLFIAATSGLYSLVRFLARGPKPR